MPVTPDNDTIERIARAFHAQPCPPWEATCNPDVHDWDFADEEDKQWMRETVRFILTEAGLG